MNKLIRCVVPTSAFVRKCFFAGCLVAASLSSSSVSAGVIFSQNFDNGIWQYAYRNVYGGVGLVYGSTDKGTITTKDGPASGCMSLIVDSTNATVNYWSADVRSGYVGATTETNLDLLTLSFDLWTSSLHPVYARIISSQPNGTSGYKEFIVYPPVKGAYFRHSFDLSAATSTSGNFNPTDPNLQVVFGIRGNDVKSPWPKGPDNEIRVDNVSFTSPAYYVLNAGGNDGNTGRLSQTGTTNGPLKTIQSALDRCVAGDVVCVLNGNYGAFGSKVVGSPSLWVVLRPFSGASPLIQLENFSFSRNAVKVLAGSSYFEMRNMTVHGNAGLVTADPDGLKNAQADSDIDYTTQPKGKALYNGNAISSDENLNIKSAASIAFSLANPIHHIRFKENEIYDCSGVGIGMSFCDYVTCEGNVIHGNCWYSRNAPSGISILGSAPIDTNQDYKMFVLRNRVYDNQCKVTWAKFDTNTSGQPIPNTLSDGNGIIIDSMRRYVIGRVSDGKVLVQNNVVFNNGGAGIEGLDSNSITITNNTMYKNSTSLNKGENDLLNCDYCFVSNNLMWSASTKELNNIDTLSLPITNSYNVYASDGNTPAYAFGDFGTYVSDTNKLNLFQDRINFDFHLKLGSQAIDKGRPTVVGAALVDIMNLPSRDGDAVGNKIDAGAYEY